MTTFGRGLDLVAMMSSRWGSDLAHDGRSKSVWFEPSGDARFEDHLEGEIFDFDPNLAEGPEVIEGERMSLRLLGVPAKLFGELRRYHFEVRRELRLLAMTAPDDYPLATQITDIFVQADRERRSSAGISRLDAAIARGLEVIDLEYQVPVSTPSTMARIRDLLNEVYRAFSKDHLLALRPPDVLVDLQVWYFTEFERQGKGDEPKRWDGPDLDASCMTRGTRSAHAPHPGLGALAVSVGGALGAVARWALDDGLPVPRPGTSRGPRC